MNVAKGVFYILEIRNILPGKVHYKRKQVSYKQNRKVKSIPLLQDQIGLKMSATKMLVLSIFSKKPVVLFKMTNYW